MTMSRVKLLILLSITIFGGVSPILGSSACSLKANYLIVSSDWTVSNESVKAIFDMCRSGNFLAAHDLSQKEFPSEATTLEDLVKIDIGPDDAQKKAIEESKTRVSALSPIDKITLHRCLAQIAIARNDDTEAARHLRAIRQINPKFQLTDPESPLADQVSPKLNKLYGATKAAPSFGSLALSILGFGAAAALATKETGGAKLIPGPLTLSTTSTNLVARDSSEIETHYPSEAGTPLPIRATLSVTIVNPVSDGVIVTLSGKVFKNAAEASRPQVTGTLKRTLPTSGDQFSRSEFQLTGLAGATIEITAGSVSGFLRVTVEHSSLTQHLIVKINPRELAGVQLELCDVESLQAKDPKNDPTPYLKAVNTVVKLNNEQVIEKTTRGIAVIPTDKFGNRLSYLHSSATVTILLFDTDLRGGFFVKDFATPLSNLPEILSSSSATVKSLEGLETPPLFDADSADNSDLPYLIYAREIKFFSSTLTGYIGAIGRFQREMRFSVSPDIVGRSAKNSLSEWSLNLSASALGMETANAQIGIALAGRSIANEPATEEALQKPLTLTLIQNGNTYQRLAKALQGRQVEWELEARSNQPHQQVRLTWDRLNQIPRRYSLTLIDLETNQRLLMRGSSGYSFNMGENRTRRFKIVADLSPQARLMMTGVFVQPSRGGQTTLNFNLSKPAMVQARVRSMSGREMGVLMTSRASIVGTNSLLLSSPSMNRMPAGSYMVELEAQSDDGERVRQVVPWVITR